MFEQCDEGADSPVRFLMRMICMLRPCKVST